MLSKIEGKPLLYVAGPYSAPTHAEITRNVMLAEEVGKDVLRAGGVPVIPHKIKSFWDDAFPEFDHARWMTHFCLPLLNRCDAIVMVPGFEISKSAMQEYVAAGGAGIPVLLTPHEVTEYVKDWRRICGSECFNPGNWRRSAPHIPERSMSDSLPQPIRTWSSP